MHYIWKLTTKHQIADGLQAGKARTLFSANYTMGFERDKFRKNYGFDPDKNGTKSTSTSSYLDQAFP